MLTALVWTALCATAIAVGVILAANCVFHSC